MRFSEILSRPGAERVRGPGIDPVWPIIIRHDQSYTVVARKYLTPGMYSGWYGFLHMFCRVCAFVFFFPATGIFTRDYQETGILFSVLWVGCLILVVTVKGDFVRRILQFLFGKTTSVTLGGERITFANALESAAIHRGSYTLVSHMEPDPLAHFERDKMQMAQDKKIAAWKAWIWQQSFVVSVSYGEQVVHVARIFNPVMAKRLASGINSAERLMQADMARGRKQGSPWDRP